jgi:POT family proton-dependent oligopeptide transporter
MLAGAAYYQFFTALMLVTALLFSLVMRFYRGRTYLHQEEPAALAGRD